MNELRIFVYSRQCHQSFKKVPNKGQALLGTPSPFSGLLQPTVITKLGAQQAGHILQNPIVQLTCTSAHYPRYESRISPSM
jgi:hypothetical protein